MPNYEVTLKFGYQGEERTYEVEMNKSVVMDHEIKTAALQVANTIENDKELVDKYANFARVKFYRRIK